MLRKLTEFIRKEFSKINIEPMLFYRELTLFLGIITDVMKHTSRNRQYLCVATRQRDVLRLRALSTSEPLQPPEQFR
jgi:hypothetical protein